jgi:hypothetical protein
MIVRPRQFPAEDCQDTSEITEFSVINYPGITEDNPESRTEIKHFHSAPLSNIGVHLSTYVSMEYYGVLRK